jgi:hypothetical protein
VSEIKCGAEISDELSHSPLRWVQGKGSGRLLGEIKMMEFILVLLNSCATAHGTSVSYFLALNELKKAPHPPDLVPSGFFLFGDVKRHLMGYRARIYPSFWSAFKLS